MGHARILSVSHLALIFDFVNFNFVNFNNFYFENFARAPSRVERVPRRVRGG